MWSHLSQSEQRKYLAKWIKAIAENERSDFALKRRIVKHAKEVFNKDPKAWAASMRNLVEIFETMKKIKPSADSQLKRLFKKHSKNPKRYV